MTDATISIIVTSITSIVLVILNRKQANRIATVANVVTEVKSNVVEQAKKVDEVKTAVAEQIVKVEKVVDEVKVVVAEQVVRVERVGDKVEKIVGAVDGYHKEVNGKMSLLLEKTEALAKAEQKIQNGNIS